MLNALPLRTYVRTLFLLACSSSMLNSLAQKLQPTLGIGLFNQGCRNDVKGTTILQIVVF